MWHSLFTRNYLNVTSVSKISASVTQNTAGLSKLRNPPPSPQSRPATRRIPTVAGSKYRRACLNLDQGISDREVLDDGLARAKFASKFALPLSIRRKGPIQHLVQDCFDPRSRCRLDIAHFIRLYALCYQVWKSYLLGYPRRKLPQCMAARGEMGVMEVSRRIRLPSGVLYNGKEHRVSIDAAI